jgi:hypothetical protein
MRSAHASSSAPTSARASAGYTLLVAWLLATAWGFWLVEGQPAHARAQLASDPASVERIERWGRQLGAGSSTQPLLALLPSACVCEGHGPLRERLGSLAVALGVNVVEAARPQFSAMPGGAGLALFSPQGRLLFAGPLQSPLHCSGGRSLAELLIGQAFSESPPLWAPVLDEPCACLSLRA